MRPYYLIILHEHDDNENQTKQKKNKLHTAKIRFEFQFFMKNAVRLTKLKTSITIMIIPN